MKAFSICRLRRGWRQPLVPFRIFRFAGWAALLASTFTLMAAPEVQTLTGGPSQFYPQNSAGSVYVLNVGNGANSTVLKFASPALGGDLLATSAANLVNAAGIALDSFTNIYVTVQGNTLIQITPAGVRTTIATITNAGVSLKGI